MTIFSLEDFWTYRDGNDPTVEGGFEIFSKPHFIWLGVLFLFTLIYAIFYYRSGEKSRSNMRKSLAIFLIMYEIFHQSVSSFVGVPRGLYLPLEFCSLAEYTIMFDALWPENRITKQFLVFPFLPAAIIALTFPTANIYPPISMFAMHQFIMHGLIVAYVIARYTAGEIKPRYYGLWISFIALLIILIPIYHIDKTFGVNYMFIMGNEGNPALTAVWNLTGGNGGIPYIIGLASLVLLVMHIMYFIYKLLGKLRGN